MKIPALFIINLVLQKCWGGKTVRLIHTNDGGPRQQIDSNRVSNKSEKSLSAADRKTFKSYEDSGANIKFSLPSIIASGRQLPLVTSGSCSAGVSYKIEHPKDLHNFLEELECVFNAGHVPNMVGLGFHYGTLLLAANSASLDIFAKSAYQGDYVIRTHCNNKYMNIGVLNLGGINIGTAEWYIGAFPGEIIQGEHLDNRRGLVMDFRAEMEELCPPEGDEDVLTNRAFLTFRSSRGPAKTFVDMCRVVGRDSVDRGLIYLCRGLSENKSHQFSTVLFYALKNIDDRVDIIDYNGRVRPFHGEEEIIVQNSFSYSRRGMGSTFAGIPASLESLKHTNDLESVHDMNRYEEYIGDLVRSSDEAKSSNIALVNALLEKGSA